MPEVQVLRRAVRWDLTCPTFSSRASMSELKVKLSDDAMVPDVLSFWRRLTTGRSIYSLKIHKGDKPFIRCRNEFICFTAI